jgi:glycerol uptake facilitator-like aquaporin
VTELADLSETGTGELHLALTRRLAAEAVGTCLLIIAVIGSGIMASRLSPTDDGIQLLGAWIGGAYWFTSSTSFANPAVTIARMLSNGFAGIKQSSAPMFIAMQLVGALLAYPLIRFIYPHPVQETPDA